MSPTRVMMLSNVLLCRAATETTGNGTPSLGVGTNNLLCILSRDIDLREQGLTMVASAEYVVTALIFYLSYESTSLYHRETGAENSSGNPFAALYFRYGYLSPRYRYDRITGEIQTLIKDGTWVKETRADEKN